MADDKLGKPADQSPASKRDDPFIDAAAGGPDETNNPYLDDHSNGAKKPDPETLSSRIQGTDPVKAAPNGAVETRSQSARQDGNGADRLVSAGPQDGAPDTTGTEQISPSESGDTSDWAALQIPAEYIPVVEPADSETSPDISSDAGDPAAPVSDPPSDTTANGIAEEAEVLSIGEIFSSAHETESECPPDSSTEPHAQASIDAASPYSADQDFAAQQPATDEIPDRLRGMLAKNRLGERTATFWMLSALVVLVAVGLIYANARVFGVASPGDPQGAVQEITQNTARETGPTIAAGDVSGAARPSPPRAATQTAPVTAAKAPPRQKPAKAVEIVSLASPSRLQSTAGAAVVSPGILEKAVAFCAEPNVRLSPLPAGRMRVLIASDCRPAQKVVIAYGGVFLARNMDNSGNLDFDLDLFAGTAQPVKLIFEDGLTLARTPVGEDLNEISKVAIVWTAPVNLDLHAFEYAAAFGSPGHVWQGKTATAAQSKAIAGRSRKGHGFISSAADGRSPGSQVEVYTFWPGSTQAGGVVTLSLNYKERGVRPSGETCGQGKYSEVEFEVVTLTRNSAFAREKGILTRVPCGVRLSNEILYNAEAVGDLIVRQ